MVGWVSCPMSIRNVADPVPGQQAAWLSSGWEALSVFSNLPGLKVSYEPWCQAGVDRSCSGLMQRMVGALPWALVLISEPGNISQHYITLY